MQTADDTEFIKTAELQTVHIPVDALVILAVFVLATRVVLVALLVLPAARSVMQ